MTGDAAFVADGTAVALDGATARIVRALLEHQERINSQPKGRIEIHYGPDQVVVHVTVTAVYST